MRFTILLSMLALFVLAGCVAQTGRSSSSGGTSADSQTAIVTDKFGNLIITKDIEGVDLTDLSPGTEGDFVVNIGYRVLFGYDQHSLTGDAQVILRRQAEWLKTYAEVTAVIEGHADERGTREYNLALGARRANAVRDFLIAEGVDAARLDTVSFGKERPAVLGSYEEAWAENRRSVTNLQ